MSSDDKKPISDAGRRDEGFVSRWSRRKAGSRLPPETAPSQAATRVLSPSRVNRQAGVDTEPPTDADMPPLDSLGENSDFSGFMSSGVSDELRSLALRRLFHLSQFNVTDGLDDYAEDYTRFETLGNTLTHEMRRLRELEKKLEVAADENGHIQDDPVAERSGTSDVQPGGAYGDSGRDRRTDHSGEDGQDSAGQTPPDRV